MGVEERETVLQLYQVCIEPRNENLHQCFKLRLEGERAWFQKNVREEREGEREDSDKVQCIMNALSNLPPDV